MFEYVKDMYFIRSGRFVGYAINGVVSNFTMVLVPNAIILMSFSYG